MSKKLKFVLPALASLFLSACMPSPTPEQSATLHSSRKALAAKDQKNWIMVGAEGFKKPVDVIRQSPTRAVVVPVAGSLRYVDIEDAARQATGCAARATPAIYKAVNNDPKLLMTNAKMRAFDYRLPVDLAC